jgi:hypothetical protein
MPAFTKILSIFTLIIAISCVCILYALCKYILHGVLRSIRIMLRDLLTQKCAQIKVTDFGYPIFSSFYEFCSPVLLSKDHSYDEICSLL